MNIDDLLKALLKGANITINVQEGGSGNTMYNGPVQNNVHNNHTTRREPRCNICGRSGGTDLYSHFVGYTHQSCLEEQGQEARRLREKRQAESWQILRSTPDELPEPPRQLSAASTKQENELDPIKQWDMWALEYLLNKDQ